MIMRFRNIGIVSKDILKNHARKNDSVLGLRDLKSEGDCLLMQFISYTTLSPLYLLNL